MTLREEYLKSCIRNQIAHIKWCEQVGYTDGLDAKRDRLNYWYAELANEQDTTYPTL